MIKVEGHQNLYRDEISGAIINTDSSAYNQYVSSIERSRTQKEEMVRIKNDIDEIKSLLKSLTMGENINI
jgi:hypothetical protein